MSAWLLWLLIVVLPNIGAAFEVLAAVTGVAAAAAFIAYILTGMFSSMGDGGAEAANPWIKKALVIVAPVFLLSLALNIASPDREEIMYIVGGYFVTNVEDIEKLPPNLVKSTNRFLEDCVGEEQ